MDTPFIESYTVTRARERERKNEALFLVCVCVYVRWRERMRERNKERERERNKEKEIDARSMRQLFRFAMLFIHTMYQLNLIPTTLYSPSAQPPATHYSACMLSSSFLFCARISE